MHHPRVAALALVLAVVAAGCGAGDTAAPAVERADDRLPEVPTPDTAAPGTDEPTVTTGVPVDPPSSTPVVVPGDSGTEHDWRERAIELDPVLGALLPTVDELGDAWVVADVSSVDPAPADPADAIDGCDAPPPPELAGLSLRFRLVVEAPDDRSAGYEAEGSLELAVFHEPDAGLLDTVVESFTAVFDCPPETLFPVSGVTPLEALPPTAVLGRHLVLDTGDVPGDPPVFAADAAFVLLRSDPHLVGIYVDGAGLAGAPAPLDTIAEARRLADLVDADL